jgi:hypothetical protein
VVLAGGSLLVLLQIAVAIHSTRFGQGSTLPVGAIPLFVGLQISAGLVYLAVIRTLRQSGDASGRMAGLVIVGVLLRTISWFSQPILEDDYDRYLWDGAATSAGVSPYRYSPADVLDRTESIPERLRLEALSSGALVTRINHPDLTTIYPPVAQLAFFVAHVASPFSLHAWKVVLLVADVGALLLIAWLLKFFSLPREWIVVFWWNPLFIKETYNSAHLDVLLVPLLLGAIVYRIRDKPVASALFLALAGGVKLWPVLLAPLFLGRYLRRETRNLLAPLLFSAITIALIVPMMIGSREHSGLLTFAGRWEMNDAFFASLAWISRFASPAGPEIVRFGIAAAIGAFALALGFRKHDSPRSLIAGALAVTATLFLLSPAQFPWYFTWLLPLLAVVPFMPLIALTAALPLYYLRFHFVDSGTEGLFDNGIVFLEWVPIWGLLLVALARRLREARLRREAV